MSEKSKLVNQKNRLVYFVFAFAALVLIFFMQSCTWMLPPAQVPPMADKDHDGIADKRDNCPNVYNPDQADSDRDVSSNMPAPDGFGDACDNCPRVPNSDADKDGVADSCPYVRESVAKVAGNLVKICFEYDGPVPAYLIKPDCFNTTITCKDKEGKILPPRYRIPPPYGIVIEKDGTPGGSVIYIPKAGSRKSYEVCVTCDLLDLYHPKVLASAKTLKCEATYANYIQDPDLNPATLKCDDPKGECIDIWTGAVTSDPFSVQYVKIHIKPDSDPSGINIKEGGVVSVAINGSGGFEVRAVDPESVLLGTKPRWEAGKRPTPIDGCPARKWWSRDWQPDGFQDLILLFETSCLRDTAGVTVDTTELTLIGNTVDRIPVMGRDKTVRVHK